MAEVAFIDSAAGSSPSMLVRVGLLDFPFGMLQEENAMALCHRLKVGLVAAAAAAGVLAGAGLADAAPMHSPGAPHGGHSTSRDVGVPGEVDSSAAAIAPDGTRINGVTAVPFGGHRTREGATPDSVRSLSVQGALQVDILARGARLRAWVPNGTVLGLAYPGQTAWGGCQIPGSDGWVWGWLSVKTAAGWRSGWMRHDLWSVSELTHPGVAAGVNDLPWC